MKVVVDRIENNIAVLVIKGRTLTLPVEFFNFEIYEGMHLDIEFKHDLESEEKTKKEIKALQDDLLDRNNN